MNSNTARVLHIELNQDRTRRFDAHARTQGKGRNIAVAKFRELADKLESGELDGARAQWRDDHSEESEMQTVTLTADAETKGGTVQLLTTKIEEV